MDMRGVVLSGDLKLAITEYFRATDLAGLLKGLSEQYQRLRLHVFMRKNILIEHDIDGPKFDLGLAMMIVDGAGVANSETAHRCIPLRREPLKWVASASYKLDVAIPLPLITLPDDCSVQRHANAKLKESDIPYFVAHTASGVSGLQSALSAGLGIACLNASSVPHDVREIGREANLPPLPLVEFSLLVPHFNDSDFVREAAEVLLDRFK